MLISLHPARQSERAEGLDGMGIFRKRKWSLLRQHRHPVCRHTSGIGITFCQAADSTIQGWGGDRKFFTNKLINLNTLFISNIRKRFVFYHRVAECWLISTGIRGTSVGVISSRKHRFQLVMRSL